MWPGVEISRVGEWCRQLAACLPACLTDGRIEGWMHGWVTVGQRPESQGRDRLRLHGPLGQMRRMAPLGPVGHCGNLSLRQGADGGEWVR